MRKFTTVNKHSNSQAQSRALRACIALVVALTCSIPYGASAQQSFDIKVTDQAIVQRCITSKSELHVQ